ncbi:MAG: hypothetical protein WDA16_14300, partial [Candidatus Thermoplasmatota archaeon]
MAMRLQPRSAVLVTLLFAAGILAPIMPLPTAAATIPQPEVLETLVNGGLEGAPSAANGYELSYDGAQRSVVAHGGTSSVDLAKATAKPQPSYALGGLTVFTTHPVYLTQVKSISFFENLPTAPPAIISLRLSLKLDTNHDGVADKCLIHDFPALDATVGWTNVTLDVEASFIVGTAACGSTGTTRTLSSIQADSLFANARVSTLNIQTLVNTQDAWPPGA